MAVDLTGIDYTVQYMTNDPMVVVEHPIDAGVNTVHAFEHALIHVKPPKNEQGFTDLYSFVGPDDVDSDMHLAIIVYTMFDSSVIKAGSKIGYSKVGYFPAMHLNDTNYPVDQMIEVLASPTRPYEVATAWGMDLDVAAETYESDKLAKLWLVAVTASLVEDTEDTAGIPGIDVTIPGETGIADSIVNTNSITIDRFTKDRTMKDLLTKSAIAGNIFSSLEECATQAAFSFMYDCLASVKNGVDEEIAKLGVSVMSALGDVATQIAAAVDIIQTAALLPFTQGLKKYADTFLSNGKYVVGAYDKFMAKVGVLAAGLPLGLLVDIGGCVMQDPYLQDLVRQKNRVLDLAKDGLVTDEALTLLQVGYQDVVPIAQTLRDLTSSKSNIFKGPTARLVWGSVLPKYMEYIQSGDLNSSFLAALNTLEPEDRLTWSVVADTMQRYTSIQDGDTFRACLRDIFVPEYISMDYFLDPVAIIDDTPEEEEITAADTLQWLMDLQLVIGEYRIDFDEIQRTVDLYRDKYVPSAIQRNKDAKGLLDSAQTDYQRAWDAWDDAVSNGDTDTKIAELYEEVKSLEELVSVSESNMVAYQYLEDYTIAGYERAQRGFTAAKKSYDLYGPGDR